MDYGLKKIVQRVQKRDGLPKACLSDAWLDACRKGDTAPLLGGIAWANQTLVVVARIDGKVHALPFSKFTAKNAFRDALSEPDKATYDKLRADALTGAFNPWAERKMKEIDSGIGF